MFRFIKNSGLWIVVIFLTSCSTTPVIETISPTLTEALVNDNPATVDALQSIPVSITESVLSLDLKPTEAAISERKKLFDDDIYVTIAGPTYHMEMYVEPKQWFVYDNYGDMVANYLALDYSYWYESPGDANVFINQKTDVTACHDYHGVFNLFSYEKLGYVIDDAFPFNAPFRKSAYSPPLIDELEFSDYAEDPIIDGNSYSRIYASDFLVWLRARYEDQNGEREEKLLLYRTGKDISNLLKDSNGANNCSWVYSLEGYAIISKYDGSCMIIDKNGEVLYTCNIAVNASDMVKEQHIINLHGTRYSDYIKSEHSYARFLDNDFILIEDIDSDFRDNCSFTLLDWYGNLIFEGKGHVWYLGYKLFALTTRNYRGVINARGEWVARILRLPQE